MDLYNQITNTIINSIPEELFITTFILILLGKYKHLSKDTWKENLFRIMVISVIPMAIFSNGLTYIGHVLNKDIELLKVILGISITGITIIGICGMKNIKEFGTIMGVSLLGFLFFIATELLTATIAVYGLHVSVDLFTKSPYLNFVIVIPERLIQYGILIYNLIKKNSISQINISKLVFKNKILKITTIIFSIIDCGMFLVIIKFIFFSNVLSPLSQNIQLFIVVTGMSFAIINILTIWLIALSIYPKEKYLQKYGKGGDDFEE